MARAFLSFVSLITFLVALLSPRTARAQPGDAVGIRAQGMAGAFTAVANDATATWWNPAGLAAGPYFNIILESSVLRQPSDENATPAWRLKSRGISVAYPALGLSYYRLQINEIRPETSTAEATPGRQDRGTVPVRLRSIILNQYGATAGQSLGEHFVLASTLKLTTGHVASSTVIPRSSASFDLADRLEGERETHSGLDLGAMARFGGITIGVAARNLTEPTFGFGDDEFTLKRQVRAGIAYGSGHGRGADGVTVAADMDLTTAPTATGDERRLAAGAEMWQFSRRVGLRGGVGLSTIGDARPTGSAGASIALRSGTYADAEITVGADETRRGWGAALRVTF
jgi:hypothetical protein